VTAIDEVAGSIRPADRAKRRQADGMRQAVGNGRGS
jgi:hypothetical protein